MEKNTGDSYIRRPEGWRVVTRTGLEGQVSGRVFQRPISKFNFRAKTSLCLFSFTSFLLYFLFPPLSSSVSLVSTIFNFRIRKACENLVSCFSSLPFFFYLLFAFCSFPFLLY
jgi:hypothetical protein